MTCMINISLYKYSICHFDNQISQPTLAFPLLLPPPSTQFTLLLATAVTRYYLCTRNRVFAGLLELFLLWWVVDGLFSTWRTKARTRYIDFLRPKHKQYTFAHRRMYVCCPHPPARTCSTVRRVIDSHWTDNSSATIMLFQLIILLFSGCSRRYITMYDVPSHSSFQNCFVSR